MPCRSQAVSPEKRKAYPESPSGIPGVQTTLGLLLTAVRDGWLQPADIVRLCSVGPARVFGIEGKGEVAPGFAADLVLVDPKVGEPLPAEWLRSRAGYSPYQALPLAGWPRVTVLGGQVVYRDHAAAGPARGRPLSFAR